MFDSRPTSAITIVCIKSVSEIPDAWPDSTPYKETVLEANDVAPKWFVHAAPDVLMWYTEKSDWARTYATDNGI